MPIEDVVSTDPDLLQPTYLRVVSIFRNGAERTAKDMARQVARCMGMNFGLELIDEAVCPQRQECLTFA